MCEPQFYPTIEDPYQFLSIMTFDERLKQVATSIVHCAASTGLHVSTAESCTAGLVSATIADISGASDVLLGGVCTYTNEIKHRVLSVDQQTLNEKTAVCYEVGLQLASGSRALFGSDVAVGVTGYAGPGGGTDKDPVGTVYIGVTSSAASECYRVHFNGSRMLVRMKAVLFSLTKMLQHIDALSNN